ncbi:hypothetical protein BJY00DRAFT_313942 [Aspergillus carlsbadensis]|nr:hypothetical protein BJY00DRAFT_313942 [Aspergillus carlsbadensis]
MSPSSFPATSRFSCVGSDANGTWASQLVPAGHVGLSDDPTKQPYGTDPMNAVSSAKPEQPYTISSAINTDFSGPSVLQGPSWLAVPYSGFSHANEPTTLQSINSQPSTHAYASQDWLSNEIPTQKIEDLPHNPLLATLHGPAGQTVHDANPKPFPQRVLVCEWRGCNYTGTFSRHAQLKRHVDTKHIYPGSFVCPVPGCGRAFNRKDNLGVHFRQFHRSGNCDPQYQTGGRVVDLTGENVIPSTGE